MFLIFRKSFMKSAVALIGCNSLITQRRRTFPLLTTPNNETSPGMFVTPLLILLLHTFVLPLNHARRVRKFYMLARKCGMYCSIARDCVSAERCAFSLSWLGCIYSLSDGRGQAILCRPRKVAPVVNDTIGLYNTIHAQIPYDDLRISSPGVPPRSLRPS